MTLDQEFARYQGQSVLVPGQSEALRGQCFMWFDFVLHDVYALPYFYAQGAIDIWNNPGWLLDHFDKISDGSIKKGDIVVFNQSVGSIYGHVDIAMQDGSIDSFLGSDSNWGGNKTVHLVNHIGRQYVLGSLRLKGNTMSDLVKGDIDNLLKDFGITPIASDYGAVNLTSKDFAYWLERRLKQCLVSGDVDNLLKDVGIVPTQADYDAVKAGPKPFAYYLQKRLKGVLGTVQPISKDSVIKYIQEKLT